MIFSKKLKKFHGIKHCFFSRKGGCSTGIYRGLNCGRGSKDFKKNVSKNLNYVSKKINVKKENLILMHQTHSNKVIEIKRKNYSVMVQSDAMISKLRGVALGVLTADCVPILVYDKQNGIIGCIHAGWKGAFSGIIEKTIKKIKKQNSFHKIYASIGPCIGKRNYEVDLKFFRKFLSLSSKNKIYFIKKNNHKKLFNLRKFVADKLLKLKVKIDHVNYDTFDEKNNFFSFRRSCIRKEKDYGRCVSVIKIV